VAAHADPGHDNYGRDRSSAYIGFAVGQLRYNEDGLATITPGAAMLRVGASLSPNLAFEGRIGGGGGRAATDYYGVSVKSLYAAYLKGSLPVSPGFSLYGLGGGASVDLERDFGQATAHDGGFSYGLGADFALGRGPTLNIEWTRLVSGENLGYHYYGDLASVGLVWHF
jgi:hypothetical protein